MSTQYLHVRIWFVSNQVSILFLSLAHFVRGRGDAEVILSHGYTQKNTDICWAEGQVLYFVRVRLRGSVAHSWRSPPNKAFLCALCDSARDRLFHWPRTHTKRHRQKKKQYLHFHLWPQATFTCCCLCASVWVCGLMVSRLLRSRAPRRGGV